MTEPHHQTAGAGSTIAAEGQGRFDPLIVAGTTAVVAGVALLVGPGRQLLDWGAGLGRATLAAVLMALVALAMATGFYARRKFREAEASRLAGADLEVRDRLTGLPNRRTLRATLDELLRKTRSYNGRVAVLAIDLDGFKKVNDAYGHEAGDRLMREMAGRLEDCLGPNDRLLRYAGDQFIALCPDVTNAASAERIAKRMLRAVSEPWDELTDNIRLSGTVGVVASEVRCSRPDDLLIDANAALDQAKAGGPGRYAIFDRSLTDTLTPSTAARRLRDALEGGEFRLYYQPIVSLWTRRMVGVEALLRWRDPGRGLVSPAEFMPALEQTGLIVPVGAWILEEVCAQSGRWTTAHPDRPPVNIKVNVSARQLAQADVIEHLRGVLSATGTAPERITLEISEAALMYDVSSAWSTLREAKELGIAVALDDFGTGYSSLAYLRQLDLDLINIDRTFVEGLTVSREDAAIVEHVIGMAKALGIVTVAEGVETEVQADRLRELSCDLAQGYFFSHPQPPDVIAKLIAADGNRQEWKPPDAVELPADLTDDAAVVDLRRFAGGDD